MIDRLLQLYETVNTRDGIQIALLTLVLFAVWHFLGRTITGNSAIGRGLALVVVGLFLLAQVIVASLDLTELCVILDYVLTTFLIGLLVVFQPELRRGLMMLGQASIWRFLSPELAPIADRLTETAECLSRECVGALIVVERETNLEPYCESGERIDAGISVLLLRTLFAKNTPLHDGAVILRNGRLVSAACQLPLRVQADHVERYGHQLGMRHRAALCMSEETDAVILVVSEETGRISVAIAGRLIAVARENLARQLAELLSSSAGRQPHRQAA